MAFNLFPWSSRSEDIKISNKDGNIFSAWNKEISSFFDNIANDFKSLSTWSEDKDLTPAVDIIDNERVFRVEAELPGIKAENVEVDIGDNLLTIKGEKKASKEDKGENYVHRERYYGKYLRTISLPENVDTSRAKATFKKGVLWVEVPKTETRAAPKFRKLEIKEAA